MIFVAGPKHEITLKLSKKENMMKRPDLIHYATAELFLLIDVIFLIHVYMSFSFYWA